nr:MAG TPA: hypothetical protein [Caudoviricetes sp.]
MWQRPEASQNQSRNKNTYGASQQRCPKTISNGYVTFTV